MNVTRKDATISNTDEEGPGAFEVVLSTPSKDRDGDELAAEDWKTPLPEHITFDTDHGMSVASTVGSGVPSIEDGKLIVRGTYSSLPRAQEVRTLVKEGHIRTTSVAFMSEKVTKDGKTRTVRELLNGAFVAIPSNREAVVLSAKAGARNSGVDQGRLQAAHDAIVAAGAMCGPMDDTQAEEGAMGGKSYDVTVKAKYSAEQLRTMLSHGQAYRNADGEPSYPIGDQADLSNAIRAVGRGGADHDAIRAYIIRRARALGASDMIPDNWNADGSLKSLADAYLKAFVDAGDTISVARLAQAVDASIDDALLIINQLDRASLDPQVRQLVDTVTAAAVCVDHLLDAMNIDNPDEGAAAGDAASADAGDAAKSVDAEALELKYRLLNIEIEAATTAG